MDIGIYCLKRSPRLSYLLDFIFGHFFDAGYRLFDDLVSFKNFDGPKICYDSEPIDDSLWIYPHSIVFEKNIQQQVISLQTWAGEKGIFLSSADSRAFCIDVFAQSFYFLSRYEEYLPFKKDNFGRFSGKLSFAYFNKIHHLPIVDIWLLKLREALQRQFPSFSIPLRPLTPIMPTIDIDNPWEIQHLAPSFQWAKLVKNVLIGKWKKSIQLFNTIARSQKDPFDYYEMLIQSLQHFPETKFFFLLSNSAYPDNNRHLGHPAFQEKLHQVKKYFKVGIHPSVSSNSNMESLKTEFQAFEKLTDEKANTSRQHYLCLRFPETYSNLIKLGIRQDFSMGYHDICGFRAGSCRPFLWFDLNNETSTELTLNPFQWMDVSLNNYLQLKPGEAIQLIRSLKEEVKKVRGMVSFIWHNSSFDQNSGWNDWSRVYEESLNLKMPE
jgi:hypothetical protein